MKKERLDILCSVTACIAVTYMADGHTAGKQPHLLFIEDLSHKTATLDPMEDSIRIDSDDSTTLLSSVLKGMQTIICQTCSIFNTIYSKHTTFVMQLIISITIITLTHNKYIYTLVSSTPNQSLLI